MPTLNEQIQEAEKSLQNARRILANHRERIASGKCFNDSNAQELIEVLVQAVEELEKDMGRLLADRIST